MISFLTEDNMSVIRTNKQFVVIINDEIHGPFLNEYAEIIINLIKKGGQPNDASDDS